MELPLPMLAKAVSAIPTGEYTYEPKWDGFRALVQRRGDEVNIGSRGGKPLTRYFPELVDQFRRQLPDGVIVDGEIIVITDDQLDFSALQQRIHPAASRITLLCRATPASFVAFDLLHDGKHDITSRGFRDRRGALANLFTTINPPLYLSASTDDIDQAREWFETFEGAGLDGIVAKPWDLTYQSDVRAMLKIKHSRTADCVVAGLRWHKNDSSAVGALLLGLYDEQNRLHYVGSTSSFTMSVRQEMGEILKPLIVNEGHPWFDDTDESVRRPGAISRWSGKKDLSFAALDPVLVCEVKYDQLEGDRFRHTTTFVRWRPDREPESCRYDQLELPIRYDLSLVLR